MDIVDLTKSATWPTGVMPEPDGAATVPPIVRGVAAEGLGLEGVAVMVGPTGTTVRGTTGPVPDPMGELGAAVNCVVRLKGPSVIGDFTGAA